MQFKGILTRQAELLLSSQQRALMYTVVLAMFPYCAWMAVVVVALITLRKGERDGGQIVLVAMVAHTLSTAIREPLVISVINTTILFVPCYLAACILRITASWQAVAGTLLLLVTLASLGVQVCAPQWVLDQYQLLKSVLLTNQPDQLASQLKWLNETSGVSELVMANCIFGFQLMSGVISVVVSLIMARSLQSRLYYPRGFAAEVLGFRGNRLSGLLFLTLGLSAWQLNGLAINILPAFAFLYLMAGLSICASLLIAKTARFTGVLLGVPLIFIPFVMVPVYIAIGLLDGVLNLRVTFCRERG